jgi:hypothetical protein
MKKSTGSAALKDDRMKRKDAPLPVMVGGCCMMIDFIGFDFPDNRFSKMRADLGSQAFVVSIAAGVTDSGYRPPPNVQAPSVE